MKLQATQRGTWPGGVHWPPGEVREIDVPEDAEVPAWLVAPKAKKKTTKKAEKAD